MANSSSMWTSRGATLCALGVLLVGLVAVACGRRPTVRPIEASSPPTVSKIAFGSCLHQNEPQPIWDAVVSRAPDIFLFSGDNVYADTADMDELRRIYEKQAAHPGVQALFHEAEVLGTWDDHDYGANDGGYEFVARAGSKQELMRFFDLGSELPMASRDGVFQSRVFGPRGRRVQVLLLDTRWFRGPLTKRPGGVVDSQHGRYVPSSDENVPLLGEAQWEWLGSQLAEPADLRVIVTSIQLIPNDHGWEKWGNLPTERERFLDLIRDLRPNGVVLISGDRHMAEISRLDEGMPYPLLEVTSSGLNRSGGGRDDEPNRYRVGDKNYRRNNFGWIEVDWASPGRPIRLEVRDEEGEDVLSYETTLQELRARD